MDALPIQEKNETEFNSQRQGLMHACGHDAHTAMLMGAATILKGIADRGRLPGNIRLLFQPSEENLDSDGKSGGERMVQEGAVDGLNAVFALHVLPVLDAGIVGTIPGPIMAAGDVFNLTIHGIGGHGAAPHRAIDPIVLAAHVIHAVQNIISRRINPLEPGVISICSVHGGTAHNIIPASVEMSGTIRCMSEDSRKCIHEELRRACSVVETFGGTFELDIKRGIPAVVNEPEATQDACDAVSSLLGDDKLIRPQPIMGSEDFSFMLDRTPGSLLFLGVRNPSWDREYPLHTSTFRIDEDALPVGTAALTAIAIRRMKEKRQQPNLQSS
jgi:amidohydrolase